MKLLNKPDLAEQFEDLKRQKEAMVHQYEAMEQENRRLKEQTARFRSMIVKKRGKENEQVDDATTNRAFVTLRNGIQKIVHKFYQKDPRKRPMAGKTSKSLDFLNFWDQGFTSSQIQSRLRAKVFSIIYDNFLSMPRFGFEDWDSTGELERGLVMFESAVKDAKNMKSPSGECKLA
ncbi:hypothetical protein G7Y89_g11125 [Cudoniella acicularis]|uniref:Uncharacterized protein n=1 Tax=Cudoniella acicularis TaxID=354080 RepID=A0A8H4RBG5_9HELO|nr:hypothetical protein G7Y89_g11125 [Cudoniella acicularis]